MYSARPESPHDVGVHEVAALSARLAFVFMCVGLCWGIFTSTGWIHRLTGRHAARSSHLILVTLALAFASMHVLAFLFMQDTRFGFWTLTVPLLSGDVVQAIGIVSLELMFAIVVSRAVVRFLRYRHWLWLHRLGYPAVGLGVLHSFVGAAVDGHLAALWLFGLAVFAPTVVLTVARFVPAERLAGVGLLRVES
jgi:sulfoxide reductase heme-binding subunit YedZ